MSTMFTEPDERVALRQAVQKLAGSYGHAYVAEKTRNGEPHKLERVEWFRLDGLPAPLHSQFPYVLEKYRGRL